MTIGKARIRGPEVHLPQRVSVPAPEGNPNLFTTNDPVDSPQPNPVIGPRPVPRVLRKRNTSMRMHHTGRVISSTGNSLPRAMGRRHRASPQAGEPSADTLLTRKNTLASAKRKTA